MGRLLDEITRRVRQQLDRHGLVLWLDPERHYGGVVDALEQQGLPVLRATEGYFALRRRLDAWLDADARPTGLVWVPAPEGEARWALCELASVAGVMSPGGASQAQNTRLAALVRAALPSGISDDVRKSLATQAETGRYSIDELDALVSSAGEGARAALAVVFETGDVTEIALRLLAGPERDARVADKDLTGVLADAFATHLGVALPAAAQTPAALRDALALAAFSTVWRARISGEHLAHQAVERCHALLTAWRDRLAARDEYVRQARSAQALLGSVPAAVTLDALLIEESFEAVDQALIERVEAEIERNPSDAVHEALCRRARSRFWSQAEPVRMERWTLLESTARVLRLAKECARSASTARSLSASDLSARYTSDGAWGSAWSALDTAYRHMERRFHSYDVDPNGRDACMERLVAAARQQYASFTADLAEHWLRQVAAASFALPGVRPQRETFARHVRPRLEDGPVAYVLVDGLRYEMARELVEVVRDLGMPTLAWSLGTLPSVTEIGMAALMPGAEEGARLEVGRDGQLGLVVQGEFLRNRKERMDYLVRQVPGATVFKLGDVVPSKRGIREKLAAARLAVVTVTDELDGLGDGMNPEMARRLMDDVLAQIRRAVKVLFQLGVRSAVITADHGHLFGEALDTDRHVPPPGGQTAALHRRAWIGRGGAADGSVARFTATQLGLAGDLEVAVPWSTACFTAGGATGGYFHGGGSPQELIVPVLTVESGQAGAPASGNVNWTLTPSRPKLSSLVATVIVGGEVDGLFSAPSRRVRIEVRDGRKVIGRPTAAAYGLDAATGEIALEYDPATRCFRADTVTVRLEEAPKARKIRLVLLDARTDQELAQADLEVALAAW